MMVFIASLCFLSSGLGSIINLHFPKFNFVSETEVVKQSIGAFLGMLSSWLILTINGFIYYYLFGVFSFFVLVLLLSILNILLFVGVFYYIKVRSEVIFSKL
jgi:ABC-2 type transport system permease protein